MKATHVAPDTTVVVFGALGDLARRLLVPAVFNLWREGALGQGFALLGVSHHDAGDDDLRQALAEFINADARADWDDFAKRITYLRGDFAKPETFTALAGRITGNALFYLATAPRFFTDIAEGLAKAGLLKEEGNRRALVVEKPFGHDLPSAQELNKRLLACAREEQIFRIDHFLGKETVQNLLVLRFFNAVFQGVWDGAHIDHVQITAAETVGVGSRAGFYDGTGALRDMVPNHLFQLLALVAMAQPDDLGADAIRAAKSAILAKVKPVRPDAAVRGQYRAGRAGDKDLPDYRAESDVAPDSIIDTYVALRLEIDDERWRDTPFYLRTGKALAARDTEIVIAFRPVPLADAAPYRGWGDPLTTAAAGDHASANRLIIQVQPNEGITLVMLAKRPGTALTTGDVALDFRYGERFTLTGRTGYEALLHDAMCGEETLFQSAATIEAGWAAVQPLIEAWATGEPEPYVAGSDGPQGAANLLARDGRAWHRLGPVTPPEKDQ